MIIENFELILKLINEDVILCHIRHQFESGKMKLTSVDLPLGIFAKNEIRLEHNYSGCNLSYSICWIRGCNYSTKYYYQFNQYGKIIELKIVNDENKIDELYNFYYFKDHLIVKHEPEENQVDGFYKKKVYFDLDKNIEKIETLENERGVYETKVFKYSNLKLTAVECLEEGTSIYSNFFYDSQNRLEVFEIITEDSIKKEVNEFKAYSLVSKKIHNDLLFNKTKYGLNYELIEDHRFYYDDDKKYIYSKLSKYKDEKLLLFVGSLTSEKMLGYIKKEKSVNYIYDENSNNIFTFKEFIDENTFKRKRIWKNAYDEFIVEEDVKPKWILQLLNPFSDKINYTQQRTEAKNK